MENWGIWMTADWKVRLGVLDPGFRKELIEFLSFLEKDKNVIMVPYEVRRTPAEQAAFWRQSRPKSLIDKAIKMLRNNDAPFLAKTLETAGPRSGPHKTNALPGQSWHQWDLAVDCYWSVNNKPFWSETMALNYPENGYKVYAREAKSFGLTSLGDKFGWDWVHVQLPGDESPTAQHSWADIDKQMKDKFS